MRARLVTWLRQYEPGCGAVLLWDFPGDLVEIVCPQCERAGLYRRTGLVERFGDPCSDYFAGLVRKPR